MIALSVPKLKMFSPENEIFLWIKPKKKNFFVAILDQCRRLEVREKARNVFLWWTSTSVWPQGVTTIPHSYCRLRESPVKFCSFSLRHLQGMTVPIRDTRSLLRSRLSGCHAMRCVTSRKTAAKETKIRADLAALPWYLLDKSWCINDHWGFKNAFKNVYL